MLFKKGFLLVLLCFTVTFNRCAFADDDPSKLISLGLSAATAMASEKDVVKGLKTAAKDEYTSWMWDAIGGTEKFLFQNSEADIPVVKDKIMKIVGTVDSIEKFSIAMTEGKYDDAAFTAIDQAVGTVNHPLVSLTWEMAKLTYESHKLVQESGAALKVEVLFGMMNNDRRLMGTVDPKSDSPPTIPETSASADYFFNKYVMTNDSARSALQAYVTTVLGEEWPEQSWGDWISSFSAIGSGVDTTKSAELEMLGDEWRMKGRIWIIKVIKEVNKMAKQSWAEARLRQQLVEFQKFADRVGHFYNGDFAQMLKEFQNIKQIQKEIPQYSQYLAKSQSDRQSVSAKVAALKPKDLTAVGSLRNTAENWYYQCLSYSSRADLVNEKGLAGSFMQERTQWKTIMDQLQRFIEEQKGEVVDNAKEEISTEILQQGSSDYYRVLAPYAKEYFEDIAKRFSLKELEWIFDVDPVTTKSGKTYTVSADVEKAKELLLKECNQGNLAEALEIFSVWQNAAKKHLEEWKESLIPVLGNAPETEAFVQKRAALDASLNAINTELDGVSKARVALVASLPNCPDNVITERCAAIIKSNNAIMQGFDAQIPPIKTRLWALQADRAAVVNGWAAAALKAKETASRLIVMAEQVFSENIASSAEVVNAFDALANARRQQYAKLKETMEYVSRTVPQDVDGMVENMQKELQRMSEDAHTYITPFREENPNPLGAGGLLSAVASQLGSQGGFPSGVIEEKAYYEKMFDAWKQASELWTTTPQIEQKDIQAIQVLVKPDVDLKREIEKLDKVVMAVGSAPGRIKAILDKKLQIAETDRDNRDKDSYWLIEKARVINRFFREQFDKNHFKNYSGLEVVFPGVIENGMIKVNEPYPHYLLDSEIRVFSKSLIDDYNASPASDVMQKYLPDHHAALMQMLSLSGVKGAQGENFFVRNEVVYVEDMEKAETLIKKISPTGKDYEDSMAKIAKYLPLMLQVSTDKENAYYENQAKLYGMKLEEYQKKVLRRSLSQNIYAVRNLDLTGEGVDQHKWGKKYLELYEKVKVIVGEHYGAAMLEQQRVSDEQVQAEIKRKEEEATRKALAESNQMLNAMDPFQVTGFYGYAIENPRLNSRSTADMRGDVVMTKKDLIAGEMIVEARLFTIDKAKTMLLSDDGGRTWKEIGLSQNISFRFTPLPDKAYDFIVRIKTTDDREPQVRIFNNLNSIIYRDVDFEQLIVGTVKTIADAYEQTNVSLFSDHVSRDYLGNKAILEEGIRFDFDMFINIRLTLYINRIEQRGNLFAVETKWDKTQTPRKTGEEQRTSGKTTFTFVLEDGKMKIKNLRGDLIYATLSPEIAQASGKSSTVVDDIRTARDDRNPTQPGAGTTDDDGGLTSSSDDETASITVTSPNGGESWALGSTHNVTWTSSGVVDVHIEYSEGGAMWFDVVASTSASNGTYSWDIGLGSPGASQVRITAVEDPLITDTSDSTFTLF